MSERLFLAIPVRLYHYDQIQHDCMPLIDGRWRDESSLHVTITFLGNRYSSEEVIRRLHPFQWRFDRTELTRFDYFTKSRVFVVTTTNDSLQRLYEQLESLLHLEHTVLRPHVTLMRVKRIIDHVAFTQLLQSSPSNSIGIVEPKVALYRSRLFPDGAKYDILYEWPI